jgi:hypothetical protein
MLTVYASFSFVFLDNLPSTAAQQRSVTMLPDHPTWHAPVGPLLSGGEGRGTGSASPAAERRKAPGHCRKEARGEGRKDPGLPGCWGEEARRERRRVRGEERVLAARRTLKLRHPEPPERGTRARQTGIHRVWRGKGPTLGCATTELPRLARPEGCCDTYCLPLRGVRAWLVRDYRMGRLGRPG